MGSEIVHKTESQPETGWKLEFERNLLKIVHTTKHGYKHLFPDAEYEPGTFSRFEETVHPDDVKIEITPYNMKTYGKDVDIFIKNYIVERLNVGLVDDKWITFIAIEKRDTRDHVFVNQYFFDKDGNPSNFFSDGYQGPFWPSQRPQVINAEMYLELAKLGLNTFSKSANKSLSEAISKLS